MELDIEKYRHHLDGFDMTEDQKTDYIRALGLIMQSFVDLAWGTDSTQIILGTDERGAAREPDNPLSSGDIPSLPFNAVTRDPATKG